MGRIDFLGGLDSFRLRRLIREAIDYLELDLTGLRVLTEAASHVYAATPVIAAAAGATVFALSRDAVYASVPEIRRQVTTIADAVGVNMDQICISTDRASIPSGFNVITNLGFVRPLDAALIERLVPGGAVSYMCEAWEVREGDVDLKACDRLQVPVGGVWEDFGELNIFRSCGQLAVKLCFEAGLEVSGNRFILISADRFGPVIKSALEANLATVDTVSSAADLTEGLVAQADGIIVADYTTDATILGGTTKPSIGELAEWNSGLVVIQFAGCSDLTALRNAGIRAYPDRQLERHRMAFTLAHLGVRPAILLHSAGLKVGELLWRAHTTGAVASRFAALVQPMNESSKVLVADRSPSK